MSGPNHVTGEALKLPATLDFAAAENLYGVLSTTLEKEPHLRIDASSVETLTLPCAQIILSAQKTYAEMSIENPSEAFTSAFADMALPLNPDAIKYSESAATPDAGAIDTAMAEPAYQDSEQPTEEQPSVALSGDTQESGEDARPDDQVGEPTMAKRILTIDDSKTMRDMLMITLADAGFDVLQAVDGQDGINVLGTERVDVVITDINMPIMDGYEVIRQLRSNPIHKTTPILVLTTESDTDKKHLAREAGATGWMVKPFDPERLVATVRKVCP